MTICIDYDYTFTADPIMWRQFIRTAKERGHKVICATMRYKDGEGDEVQKELGGIVEEIYYSERKAKKEFLDNLGVWVDIWIDDQPNWILQDAI